MDAETRFMIDKLAPSEGVRENHAKIIELYGYPADTPRMELLFAGAQTPEDTHQRIDEVQMLVDHAELYGNIEGSVEQVSLESRLYLSGALRDGMGLEKIQAEVGALYDETPAKAEEDAAAEAAHDTEQAEADRIIQDFDFGHELFAIPPFDAEPGTPPDIETAWYHAFLGDAVHSALTYIDAPDRLHVRRLEEIAPLVTDYYERERLAGRNPTEVTQALRLVDWALQKKRGLAGIDFV